MNAELKESIRKNEDGYFSDLMKPLNEVNSKIVNSPPSKVSEGSSLKLKKWCRDFQ